MSISHHLFISLQDLTFQDTTQGLKSFEMLKKKKKNDNSHLPTVTVMEMLCLSLCFHQTNCLFLHNGLDTTI